MEKNNCDGSGPLEWNFMKDIYEKLNSLELHQPSVRNPTIIVISEDDEDVPVNKVDAYIKKEEKNPFIKNYYRLLGKVGGKILDHGLFWFAHPNAPTTPTFKQVLKEFFSE